MTSLFYIDSILTHKNNDPRPHWGVNKLKSFQKELQKIILQKEMANCENLRNSDFH